MSRSENENKGKNGRLTLQDVEKDLSKFFHVRQLAKWIKSFRDRDSEDSQLIGLVAQLLVQLGLWRVIAKRDRLREHEVRKMVLDPWVILRFLFGIHHQNVFRFSSCTRITELDHQILLPPFACGALLATVTCEKH